MKKIAILHFSPIEKYPPITNLLDFVGERKTHDWSIRVFTLTAGNDMEEYKPPSANIRIDRVGGIARSAGPLKRYAAYLSWYSRVYLDLLTWNPDLVLYYETLSAFPALLYKRTSGRSKPLFVHYHEYISPSEYAEGMALNRIFHRMEQKSFPRYDWISHTNGDRMRFFRQDNPVISDRQSFLLPNYPPKKWNASAASPHHAQQGPVRFVYVGALSMGNMYTAEFAQWIRDQKGNATWDIFSSNNTGEAKDFIEGLDTEHVRFKGAVKYTDLPRILRNYDVGVVLYKGTIPNYVYNIPNKLYEYLACGLDAWFPKEMTSCLPLEDTTAYPQIKAIDFQHMQTLDARLATQRKDLPYRATDYFYENILPLIVDKIEQAMQPERSSTPLI